MNKFFIESASTLVSTYMRSSISLADNALAASDVEYDRRLCHILTQSPEKLKKSVISSLFLSTLSHKPLETIAHDGL